MYSCYSDSLGCCSITPGEQGVQGQYQIGMDEKSGMQRKQCAGSGDHHVCYFLRKLILKVKQLLTCSPTEWLQVEYADKRDAQNMLVWFNQQWKNTHTDFSLTFLVNERQFIYKLNVWTNPGKKTAQEQQNTWNNPPIQISQSIINLHEYRIKADCHSF